MSSCPETVQVAARSSPLSRAQLQELAEALQTLGSALLLEGVYVETYGDLDQKTSLRDLPRSDFFTREVDALVLNGRCRLALHSAKDVEVIPAGIECICLTRGVDPADSLVLRDGVKFDSLPPGARIATSSQRREALVRQLRNDLAFRDLRGTISQRLQLLDSGEADGIVVAEAALIRLKLTHLNRVRLPGPTAPLQGQLAVMARCGDTSMRQAFKALHVDTPCALFT